MASNLEFWIECNNCPYPAGGQSSLSFTECGHLYCRNCVEKLNSNNNKCLICKKPTGYQALGDLSDELKEFFKPLDICGSIAELLSKLQKINKFRNKQMEIYVRNKARREHMFKKHNALLMKDIEERDAKIKNLEISLQRLSEKCTPYALSGSKLSTPNSKVFMTGILKHNLSRNSSQLRTSTPLVRNNTTPHYQIPHGLRSTPLKIGTPTHFITPKSMNGSAEQRQQILMHQQLKQQELKMHQQKHTPSNIHRVGMFESAHSAMAQKNKSNSILDITAETNNASRMPIRHSNLQGSVSTGRVPMSMQAPPKIQRPSDSVRTNPALLSYRNLIQGRAGSITGLSFKSHSNYSLEKKTIPKPSFRMGSYLKRKHI